MADPTDEYGEDGYGPEPSPEVVEVRDQFFGPSGRPIDKHVATNRPGRGF